MKPVILKKASRGTTNITYLDHVKEEKEYLAEEMLSEIEKDYAREKERTKKLNNENQQLTKYIDRLQNENLGIHRGAGIPDLKTKQAQTEN